MTQLSVWTSSLLLLSLTACMPSPTLKLDAVAEQTTAAQGLILRTYQVPAGDAPEVRRTLKALFDVKNEQVMPARVEVLPDQQLAVYATESTHESVAAVLAQLKAAVPQPLQQVKMSYWLVLAQPNEQPTTPAAALTEINAALAQISQQHGSMQFELLERLELTSTQTPAGRAGLAEEAMARGSMFAITQEVLKDNNNLVLKIGIQKNRDAPAELHRKLPHDFFFKTSLAAFEPNQLLVIGSNASDIAKGQYLYTIVRMQQ